MNIIDFRRVFGAAVATAALSLAACTGATQPQGAHDGSMMGGGMNGYGWMGGYGGPWMLTFIVAIVGLVAWVVARGRNKN